ncbi:MAG: hypothetical protein HC941_30850 [Microcoleus sp. SU_5_3]|nr:hypothetical protein [Microcoleus sp. SU_5_3]
MGTLLQSFEERSVVWIIISSGLGGVIGALINFMFQQVLTPQLQHRRTSYQALRKYSYPLLRAADKLDRRLENFINFIDENWFDNSSDDYYRISALYLFSCYFGWCKILEDEAFLEYETSDKEARLFNIEFYTVFKAMTGFHYFREISGEQLSSTKEATIPRLALTAIGELMIEERKDKNESPTIIKFTHFAQQYKSSSEFQKWFSYVERLLVNLKRDQNEARWNRVVIFASVLRGFILFLDPKHRMTTPREIPYLLYLHPQVRSYLEKEIDEIRHFQKTLNR